MHHHPPDAAGVSIIVPTYREAENLAALIDQIDTLIRPHHAQLELLIIDDNSCDGTVELIASLDKPWVHLHVRTDARDLSSAVVHGLRTARNDILIVMDADGSHAVEHIPTLIAAIEDGAEFAIGSRFCRGGSTDDKWGVLRRVNSWVATRLARPFTTISDPMSGFFAMQRPVFERAGDSLDPIGYKIGLELIVKCRCTNVHEVPIHFRLRRAGSSKLTLREQLKYLAHLRRLRRFRSNRL